jgi:predicted amidophosphoribosyltransferase
VDEQKNAAQEEQSQEQKNKICTQCKNDTRELDPNFCPFCGKQLKENPNIISYKK